MKIPWKSIASIAGRVGLAVLQGVPAIEAYTAATGHATGTQKAAAVYELVLAELSAASIAAGRDLSLDPRVAAAVRALIDDTAELHNALAAAAAAPAHA